MVKIAIVIILIITIIHFIYTINEYIHIMGHLEALCKCSSEDKYYNKFISQYMNNAVNPTYNSTNDTTANNSANSDSIENEILNKNGNILFRKENGGILNIKYGIYSSYLEFISDTNCYESISNVLNTQDNEKSDFKKYIHTLDNNKISRLIVNSCNNTRKIFLPGIVTDINKRIIFAVAVGLFLNFIILPFISGRVNFSEHGLFISYVMQLIVNILNNGIFISEHFSVLVCGCIVILAVLCNISLYSKNIFIKKTYRFNTQVAEKIYNYFIKDFIKSSMVYTIYYMVTIFIILSLNYTTIYNILSSISKFISQLIGYGILNNVILCMIILVVQSALYTILFGMFVILHTILNSKNNIALQDILKLYKLNINSTQIGDIDDEGQ